MPRLRVSFLEMSEYIGLAITALVILIDLYQDGGLWWLAVVLLLGLVFLYRYWPEKYLFLYLATELGLIAGLLILHPAALMLGFAFSTRAVVLYPGLPGVLWLAILSLLAAGAIFPWVGGVYGFFTLLGIVCGYATFGYMNAARVQANDQRRKTQALLAELQEAHRQLQEYSERIEELAVSEERNRLAREMHDTLGHRLTVASVRLEGAQRLISSDPERAARLVGTVREQVSEALAELRHTVATLRTPLEVDLPLPLALARLVQGFEGATDLKVHLALPETLPDLPSPHRLALYRAAQEGLTNVQRHAQASQVWIELVRQDSLLALKISDDGIGVNGSDPAATSFGLRGLQERAAQLGGELCLETRPEGGAQMSFLIPVPEELIDV